MATQGFYYRRVKPDWHILKAGGAVFFGRTKGSVFRRARRWLRHGTSQRAAA